jgi:hypothetical protein
MASANNFERNSEKSSKIYSRFIHSMPQFPQIDSTIQKKIRLA